MREGALTCVTGFVNELSEMTKKLLALFDTVTSDSDIIPGGERVCVCVCVCVCLSCVWHKSQNFPFEICYSTYMQCWFCAYNKFQTSFFFHSLYI